MAGLRSVFTAFSEKEDGYCDRLRGMVPEKGVPSETYDIKQGPVDEHVDVVLSETGGLPLFVPLDPYGLTISFSSTETTRQPCSNSWRGVSAIPRTSDRARDRPRS